MLKSLSHLLTLHFSTGSDFTVLSKVLVAEEQLSLVATEPNLLQASIPKCHVYAQCEMQPPPSCFQGLPHSQQGSDLWQTHQTKLVFKLGVYW